jgi:murein DD-endopeptidase MepM/ murein hydrolase activator NlpD
MRRALVCAALAAALASFAGSASADTFQVVTSPSDSVALPSAETPNEPGTLLLPTNAFSAPFGLPATRTYEELQDLWYRAGAAYGIPWQVLAAINKIESNFGRNMGPSSAGAVGWMQFMPDTWQRWGTDANGDGVSDPWNPDDAVFSAARYLAAAEGRTDISRAIFAYNHAQWYVDDVLELAQLFAGGGDADADVVFDLDRIAVALDEAQVQVAGLSEALAVAEQREAELTARAGELALVAADLDLLLSDRLPAERDAFAADQERAAAAAETERLRQELASAEAALEAARTGAHSASFAPAAAGVLGMPSRADGYVFPVGGGPGLVSVGRGHHDYPAADIAAPLGSPVFALAEAVVLTLTEDGRCGIGLTLRTFDGLDWVYCHLSHRDPGVQPGVVLGAGTWVGLVGSTGNSTGPHLHLGLQPARYPQEMPWFDEFAGIAFTWQDAAPMDDSLPSPVFAVVPPPDDAVVIEFTLTGA